MLKFLALAALVIASSTTRARPVVVELFTSQGCSSCPPADKVLRKLAAQKDVIAISWPVTYWDQLGWKDTLARPTNTQRQYRYAGSLPGSSVFTPQAVVDGAAQTIGSRGAELSAMISARKKTAATVPVTIFVSHGNISITTAAAREPYDVRLVALRASENVSVGRGENSQRVLTYTNIALQDRIIASGTEAQTLGLEAPAGDSVAVLIEAKRGHAILGAAIARLD